MTPDAFEAAPPALVLAGLYAALGLLLLSLNLRSAWPWPVKAGAIGLALPAGVGAFAAVEAQLGWPNRGALPATFQLHAALVEEPIPDGGDGAIFLWLTPWEEDVSNVAVGAAEANEIDVDQAAEPDRRPRAFDLPYSRDLHKQVEAMRERLASGELVTGRFERGSGWQRRFGLQDGGVNLDAPPPPPLPSKDG